MQTLPEIAKLSEIINKLYETGRQAELKPDIKTAHFYYQLAAEKGCIRSLYALGVIYFDGKGVIKMDKLKARSWFMRIIESGPSQESAPFKAKARAYLGAILLDNDCNDKKIIAAAHMHFCLAIQNQDLDKPLIREIADIVKNAIQKIDGVIVIYLTRYIIESEQIDPKNPKPRSLIFQPGIVFLYYIYLNTLRSQATSYEQQLFVNSLPVLKIIPETEALALAKEELKKDDRKIRPNFLVSYIAIPCCRKELGAIYFESNYYLGLCYLMKFSSDEDKKGLDYIAISAMGKFEPAVNYIKLINLPKKDPERLNLLIKAGKDAEDDGLYQVAKFYYKQALLLKDSNENLLLCAELEGRMGSGRAAQKYFEQLAKNEPSDEILYHVLDYYTQIDINRAVELLDNKDKLYNDIRKETTESNWQAHLYCARELHLAQRMLDKNKMQQALKHIHNAVEKGSSAARLRLALCYIEGWGLKRNMSAAFALLLDLKNEVEAMYYLGLITIDVHQQNTRPVEEYFASKKDNIMQEYVAHSHSAAGFIALGNKACQTNMFQIAILHYKQALNREPDNAEALFRMAFCYMQWDEYKTALLYIEKALQQDKDHAQAKLAESYCHSKLGILTVQPDVQLPEPLPSITVEESIPETASYPPIKTPKIRKKRGPYSEAKMIELRKDNIFACTTSDQFMTIFHTITDANSNPHALLRKAMSTWIDQHTEYQPAILLTLQEHGDRYAQYIEEWNLNATENTTIEPIKRIVTTPVMQTAIDSVAIIPEAGASKKNNTESRPTLKQKRQLKQTQEINPEHQKVIEIHESLHWIPQFKALVSQLQTYLNKPTLRAEDISKFEKCLQQFQDTSNYQSLCNAYAFFSIERQNIQQYPVELHQYFTNIQKAMLETHRSIELLREQYFLFYQKPTDVIHAHIHHIKQLEETVNNFQKILTTTNHALKQKHANCIFALPPLVVEQLFSKFALICKDVFLTGSAVRKQYEQAQRMLDTDLDFILYDVDVEKLIALGCVKNPYITDREVYTFKYWYSPFNWVSVDILCIPKSENWLKKDIELRDLTSALHYNRYGDIIDTSGLAFNHLDQNIIDIPGNTIERAHKEPLLLLRVIAEELRLIRESRKPVISENVAIALKNRIRNDDFEAQKGHIHAFTRKCIKKYGLVDVTKKLVEHGLLNYLFDITHQDDLKQTAEALEKKVAKLPSPQKNSVLTASSFFHHKPEVGFFQELNAGSTFRYEKK